MILFSSQFNYLATSSQCRLTFPAFLARSFMLMSPVNPVKRKNLRFGALCRNVIYVVFYSWFDFLSRLSSALTYSTYDRFCPLNTLDQADEK